MPFNFPGALILGHQKFSDKSLTITGSPLAVNDPAQIDKDSATRKTSLSPSAAAPFSASATDPTQATTLVAGLVATALQGTLLGAAYQPTDHISDTTTRVAQAPANTYIPSDPSPSELDTGMSVGEQVLNSGRSIGLLAPVPYVRMAAEIALVILDGIKKTKKNKADFEKIGKQCLTLVEIINLKVDTQTAGELGAELNALVDALVTIKGYVIKFNSRSWPRRFFFAWVDTDVVQECRFQLNFAITQFNLQSLISLRQDAQYMRDILDVSQSSASQRRAGKKRHQASEKRHQEIKEAEELATALQATGKREIAAARAFAEALMKATNGDGQNS